MWPNVQQNQFQYPYNSYGAGMGGYAPYGGFAPYSVTNVSNTVNNFYQPPMQPFTIPVNYGIMSGPQQPMQPFTMPTNYGIMSYPSIPMSTQPYQMGNMGMGNMGIMNSAQLPMMPQIYQQQPQFSLGNDLISTIMKYMQMLTGGGLNTDNNLNPHNQNPGDTFTIEDEIISAWGDPHFGFKDSTGKEVQVDHKGEDGHTYNILNADGLDIDAEYLHSDDKGNPQLMGAMRIQTKSGQTLSLHEKNDAEGNPKGIVELDGKELEVGTYDLDDGRTFEVIDGENGKSVNIKTKDGKGNINIKRDNGFYNIDSKNAKIDENNPEGRGILGFLKTLGKTKTKEEILNRLDTNHNGRLDSEDKVGDKTLEELFKTQDIGHYNY